MKKTVKRKLVPWQRRVVAEHAELSKKINALDAFKMTKNITLIPYNEGERLYRQAYAMRAYLDILTERIAAFK